jgi:hypothetical protein
MKSVNSLYYCIRISVSAPIIDFAATHSYTSHISLTRSQMFVMGEQTGGWSCLAFRRHPMTRGITLSSLSLIYITPWVVLTAHRWKRKADEMHRDHLISSHSTTLLPILSGYDYCYVYCYSSLLLCWLLLLSFTFRRRRLLLLLLLLLLVLLLLLLLTNNIGHRHQGILWTIFCCW